MVMLPGQHQAGADRQDAPRVIPLGEPITTNGTIVYKVPISKGSLGDEIQQVTCIFIALKASEQTPPPMKNDIQESYTANHYRRNAQ